MTTPMVFGKTERDAIAALRVLACANPINLLGVIERIADREFKAAHVAQMTQQSVTIPFGFLVTYSIEFGHPTGPCRHMSMSAPRLGRLPHPDAVELVAAELGFVGGLAGCAAVWIEELERGDGRHEAINLVQGI